MALSIKYCTSDSEKHACNVSVVAKISEDRVLSGSDDGILKLWSRNLQAVTEVNSNCGGILSVAVGPSAIYSCTADQTIQSWDKNTLQNLGPLKSTLNGPLKAFFEPTTNSLWVGDATGKVAKFENGTEVAKFELTEEIWDLHVTTNPNLIFTSRDRDAVVFEIAKGELRSNAIVKATMPGRYPLALLKDVVCCLDRDGRKIQVHENSIASKYKLLREIPAATMILNALCPGEEPTVYAGGYDGEVSLWDTATGDSKGAVSVGSCVNALAPTDHGVYAALTDGKVVQVGF